MFKAAQLKHVRGEKRLFRFFFFHPDYTVGIGISPIRGRAALFLRRVPFADFTAGEEFRLAPKNIYFFYIINLLCAVCQASKKIFSIFLNSFPIYS